MKYLDENGLARLWSKINDLFNNSNSNELEVLWVNQSPTTTFNSKNINLSAGDNNYYIVLYLTSISSGSYYHSDIFPVGSDTRLEYVSYNSSGVLSVMRTMTYVTDSTYNFSNVTSNNSSQNGNNKNLIPIMVLGVK